MENLIPLLFFLIFIIAPVISKALQKAAQKKDAGRIVGDDEEEALEWELFERGSEKEPPPTLSRPAMERPIPRVNEATGPTPAVDDRLRRLYGGSPAPDAGTRPVPGPLAERETPPSSPIVAKASLQAQKQAFVSRALEADEGQKRRLMTEKERLAAEKRQLQAIREKYGIRRSRGAAPGKAAVAIPPLAPTGLPQGPTPATLRQAIVFHEILQPPLALRRRRSRVARWR